MNYPCLLLDSQDSFALLRNIAATLMVVGARAKLTGLRESKYPSEHRFCRNSSLPLGLCHLCRQSGQFLRFVSTYAESNKNTLPSQAKGQFRLVWETCNR